MILDETLQKHDNFSEFTRNYSKFNYGTKHTFLEAFIEVFKIETFIVTGLKIVRDAKV